MDTADQGRARTGGPQAGIVAAAVLRAARASARMSEAFIARETGLSADTFQSWADGTLGLASVPVPRLERLEGALLTAGAEPALVADLYAAGWCDLVLAAIAAREDTVLLLADPIARTEAFAELLGWAASGQVPARYSRHAPAGRLITDPAEARRVIEVLDLASGSPGRTRGLCPNRRRSRRPERFPHCRRRN